MSHKRASGIRPPTSVADQVHVHSSHQPTLQEIINIKGIYFHPCGWRDEMKALCRAFTRKKGRNNVTVDDLVHAELLQSIRSFLASAI
ncbi:hypothetical protein P3X46_011532 [Hevea brasiliensis]|uniref:Uncharacterized protein n=1 Tax=Hevea brasiliensis TaxID=3981 RepID=A0ABQ9M8J3_HEVBR|nr:hypothetical protein P3X46_011532 [Hevea brasiliensis]